MHDWIRLGGIHQKAGDPPRSGGQRNRPTFLGGHPARFPPSRRGICGTGGPDGFIYGNKGSILLPRVDEAWRIETGTTGTWSDENQGSARPGSREPRPTSIASGDPRAGCSSSMARRTSPWPLPTPSGRVDPRPRSWSPPEARSRRRGWNQVRGESGGLAPSSAPAPKGGGDDAVGLLLPSGHPSGVQRFLAFWFPAVSRCSTTRYRLKSPRMVRLQRVRGQVIIPTLGNRDRSLVLPQTKDLSPLRYGSGLESNGRPTHQGMPEAFLRVAGG